jgi:hypothetical protein
MKAFILGALIIAFGFSALANWALEKKRIDFLIDDVAHLNATFIRNGQDYDAPTAAKHLRDKLDMGVSSDEEESFTAEDFIEKIASQSSFTGKPYFIRFADGRVVSAREWLYQDLARFSN